MNGSCSRSSSVPKPRTRPQSSSSSPAASARAAGDRWTWLCWDRNSICRSRTSPGGFTSVRNGNSRIGAARSSCAGRNSWAGPRRTSRPTSAMKARSNSNKPNRPNNSSRWPTAFCSAAIPDRPVALFRRLTVSRNTTRPSMRTPGSNSTTSNSNRRSWA